MAEVESGREARPSQTTENLTHLLSDLYRISLSIQGWSGSLDWSRRLVNEGILTSPHIIRSFSKVSRREFLPEHQKPDEGYDYPLQVGYQQTNSQPSLVGKMIELLRPLPGHAVLDVGAGSGWTTALLASAVGKKGRVVGTERIPELVEFAKHNLGNFNFPNASIHHTPHQLGMPEMGPYNRILVSAQVVEDWIPELGAQLTRRGAMLAPIVEKEKHGTSGFHQYLGLITRQGSEFDIKMVADGVGFVPLIYPEPVASEQPVSQLMAA